MKVYVLITVFEESGAVVWGVFSTREKAEAAKYMAPMGIADIEEFTLDKRAMEGT